MKPAARAALTVTLELKDRDGRKIGEREVATYAGLLAKAHDEGLSRVETALVQVPAKDNGEVAIVTALVVTKAGSFTGIGDASPANVTRKIAGHLIRMAETRAKARALRDAVNIGVVSLEELGELAEEADAPHPGHARPQNGHAPHPAEEPAPAAPSREQRKPDSPMTDAQRRALFRLAASRGAKPEETKVWLEQALGVPDVSALTRAEASRAIDKLQPAQNGHTQHGGAP